MRDRSENFYFQEDLPYERGGGGGGGVIFYNNFTIILNNTRGNTYSKITIKMIILKEKMFF